MNILVMGERQKDMMQALQTIIEIDENCDKVEPINCQFIDNLGNRYIGRIRINCYRQWMEAAKIDQVIITSMVHPLNIPGCVIDKVANESCVPMEYRFQFIDEGKNYIEVLKYWTPEEIKGIGCE